jgi:adenosylhomocysteinase
LASEWAYKKRRKLDVRVYDVPRQIDQWVAKLKLQSMNIDIDRLTAEQKKYLASSGEGT